MRPTSRQCPPRRTATERSRRPRERLSGYSALTRILPLDRLTSCSSRRVASTAWQSPGALGGAVGGQLHRLDADDAHPQHAAEAVTGHVGVERVAVVDLRTLPFHTWQCAPCG